MTERAKEVRAKRHSDPSIAGQQNQATSFGEVGLFGVLSTGGYTAGYQAVTGDATLGVQDYMALVDATSAAVTLTLPTAVGRAGKQYAIAKVDSSANAVTIDPAGSETLDGDTTVDLMLQWEALQIVSDGANWVAF